MVARYQSATVDQSKSTQPLSIIQIPQETLSKIQFLVDVVDTEVGWFGSVEVEETEQGNTIYKLQPELFVYPQLVTTSTVDPDDNNEAYDSWWIDQLCSGKRMMWHGHSHCNMRCWPSGTDQSLRTNLNADGGVHIYTIHNKKGEIHFEVYVGSTLVPSVIIQGSEVMQHEDILSQLHMVKNKPISTYSTKTPRRYEPYSWEDDYNYPQSYYDRESAKIKTKKKKEQSKFESALTLIESSNFKPENAKTTTDSILELVDEVEEIDVELSTHIDSIIDEWASQGLCPLCGEELIAPGMCLDCGSGLEWREYLEESLSIQG